MSATSAAWKTIFWTRVAGAAFYNDSPKAQAKRELEMAEYRRQVRIEKEKLLAEQPERDLSYVRAGAARSPARSWAQRSMSRRLMKERHAQLAGLRGYGAKI